MTSAPGPLSPNLDREYDLRSAFPDYVSYFEDWRSRSRIAREELSCHLDVAYGAGPRDRVDFFPAKPAICPLLVFIHGGYWRSMDKSDFSFLAKPFVKRGVSLALINYDLFPGTTMSKVVAQVRGACSWISGNVSRWGISFNRLHVAGWSAGAHLASMAACTDQMTTPFSSLLTISGVYDLRPIIQTSVNVELRLDLAEARRNSPIQFSPPPGTCPVAVIWGADETGAFRRQSSSFADIWRAKGGNVTALAVPRVHHYAVMAGLGDEGSVVFQAATGLLRLSGPLAP